MVGLTVRGVAQALPRPRRTNNAASWWASEDELLVQGIKRFGKAPASICLYFLPTKDEKAILSRIKTRCSNRAGENSIKVCPVRVSVGLCR